MIKILHIIDTFSGSGPTRSLLTAIKNAQKLGLPQQHSVISLNKQVYPVALIRAKQMGVSLIRQPEQHIIHSEIEKADIVQIHFWNSPALFQFLHCDMPSMRLLIWFHVLGKVAPQVISKNLIDFSDHLLVTSQASLDLPVFKNSNPNGVDLIYGLVDYDRLSNLEAKPHQGFNVGYIGTVNFGKMNPDFIPMSASVDIPDVKFVVCGGGDDKELKNQAASINAIDKFEFRGYVENIKSVLETLDVFGYPLCKDTSATSDITLQEAMLAGIPPVIFPYSGIIHLVDNKKTGFIVNSPAEYKQAIEFLYMHPNERRRIGENARKFAMEEFDGERLVLKLHSVYEKMMMSPKHSRTLKTTKELPGKDKGAEIFIQSLGDAAPQFLLSYSGTAMEEVLLADDLIADSSLLLTGGEGGIVQYRNYFHESGQLRVWSGLVLQKQGKHTTAIAEFSKAIKLGYLRANVYWHLYNSAIKNNEVEAAKMALRRLQELVPDFIKTKKVSENIQSENG